MYELEDLTESTVLLRLPAVRQRIGLSTATIYRRIAEGTFPRPLKVGAQSVAWIEAEIQQWLRTCFVRSRQSNLTTVEV